MDFRSKIATLFCLIIYINDVNLCNGNDLIKDTLPSHRCFIPCMFIYPHLWLQSLHIKCIQYS